MIEKNRLEELIEQGAEIWKIEDGKDTNVPSKDVQYSGNKISKDCH